MKIDWSEVSRGISDEQEKQAGMAGDAWNAVKNMGSGVANTVGGVAKTLWNHTPLGAGVNWGMDKLNNLQSGISAAGSAVGQLAPVGLGLLAASAMGGKSNDPQQQASAMNSRPKSMLNYNKAGVTSLSSPTVGPISYNNTPTNGSYKMAAAGQMLDSLVWAARNRMANHVLNEVTNSTPPGGEQSGEELKKREAKKIELVSKYPEMQELLENDQNKAYLERLLGQGV